MSIDKTGFIYLWYDRKRKMFYIGCHWGTENDGYICSSKRMRDAYRHRPQDFKRRIIQKGIERNKLLEEEFKWLSMIGDHELGNKYYNLSKHHFGHWTTNNPDIKLTISEKISKNHAKPEVKRKISESKKGDLNPMKRPEVIANRLKSWYSKPRTPWNKGLSKNDCPDKLRGNPTKGRSSPNKGKKLSDDVRLKITKTWKVTGPDGVTYITKDLVSFCKSKNICAENLRNVAYGRRKHANGYRSELI